MQAVCTLTRDDTRSRQLLFEEMYLRVFPKVAAFVSRRQGTLEDAQDVFKDALLAFYEKRVQPGLECHTSEDAYLMGIARHLWLRKYSSGGRSISLETIEGKEFSADGEPTVHAGRILEMLEQTGRKCLDLLHAFYYDQLPLQQISKIFGYGSEHSVSVQKYKCLEKLRDSVKEKSITHAHFID